MYKKCTKCKLELHISNFYTKGNQGYHSQCKNCEKIAKSNYDRTLSNRRYYLKNKDKYKKSYKKSLLSDNQLIAQRLRCRLRNTLKGKIKSKPTLDLLGCSLDEFKKYFSSKFAEDMTWDDFINGDIHIDHIKPCALFDLSLEEDQKACFHYSNLQPLWAKDNLKKHSKYNE